MGVDGWMWMVARESEWLSIDAGGCGWLQVFGANGLNNSEIYN